MGHVPVLLIPAPFLVDLYPVRRVLTSMAVIPTSCPFLHNPRAKGVSFLLEIKCPFYIESQHCLALNVSVQ